MILALLAGVTVSRVSVWGSEEWLWREAAAHSPEKPRPWINYGRALSQREAHVAATVAFEQAALLSVPRARQRLDGPMRVMDLARLNLAITLAAQGRYSEALGHAATIRDRRSDEAGGSRVEVLEHEWQHVLIHGLQPFAGF